MIYLKEGVTPLNFAYNDEIIQEGNSKYQLSFKFPTNNPLWEELVEETLLLADDLHGEQEFIIFEVEKHHAYITVYANQVATLLNNYSITELSVNNASGDRVMRSLVSSIIREHKFTFSSDIANTHSLNLKNVTVATALFKDKHSIIGQWGGDLIRDKYDIRLLSNGGATKEALFMYKKNLKSYQQKKSIKDLRTRIHFTKTINSQKEGEKDKVIAVTVDSPLINKYKNIYEGNLDVSDQDVVDEATLRKYGEQYFKTTLCDVIEENIEINVVGVPDEPVGIFDTVTIFHEKFNLDVKKKITKYTYSPMGRKLKAIGFGKIQSNLGTTLASMVDNAIEEKAETMLDAFKIQKNLSELLKLDRKGIEDKLVELEEKSKGALEVKKALFEADGTIPDVVKAKILDAVEGDIGRLKTIITEAELIKAIQAKLNFAEIKNALIDKAFINQIISDEKFTQQFEDGEVTTQNIFTKLKDSIKSNISKEFVTKDGVRKLVNDLTIDADGIRQITQQESQKVFNTSITGKVQEIVGEVKKNLPTKEELKGKSSYLHKKYSDFEDGRNMSDNSTLKYIGIYTGDKQQAPTNASEYSWTKIRGEDGARGRDGERGRDGNNGRDGVSNYIHRKYSDSSNGANMDDNSNRKYIGIYTGTSPTPPTTASSYLWSKIKGEDGANGVPGAKGADGRTPYFHTAYANSPTGDRDFSTTNSSNKLYIGTYSDFEVADSTDYRKYKWVKIKGEDGQQGVPGARGSDGRTSYLHTAYANSSTGDRDFSTTNSNGKEYIGTYTDFEINDSNDYRRYKWVKIKGENGANGRNGTDGHSLTANLRFEGKYINNVTNDVKSYLDVFYDGQKITDGFNAQVKFKGGILNNWSNFWNAKVDNTGFLTNVSWGNKEQPYPIALELIVLVTYKGLNTVANARMENVPDVVEIKEVVKKYKTFESTLEGFTSVVGEINTKVLSKQQIRQNLSSEDVEKTGNDLYFNAKENLQANEFYTILADLDNVPANQKAKIYSASDGGDEKLIQNGLNYWVVKYSTNQTKVNLYPLGANTKVKNVRIFKGDFRVKKDAERENLYSSSATDSGDKFIHLNLNKNKINGNVYTVKFDASGYSNGDRWDVYNRIGYDENNLTQLLRAKGNEFTFTINDNTTVDRMYIRMKLVGNTTISNVEIYDVSTEYVKNSQVSKLESSIKQTKDEIDLKVSKDNVINSINISAEGTRIKGDLIADYLYGKTIEGAVIQGNSKIKIGKHGYMIPAGDGLRFCLPEKPDANKGVGVQMLGNYGRDGETAYGFYLYVDPNFDTTEVAATNSYLMTVNGYISTRGVNNLKFQNYSDNSTAIGVWDKNVSLLFDRTKNDIYYEWNGKIYSIWQMVDRFYSTTSDARLKKDIRPCAYKALDLINDFKFKSFNWEHREQLEKKPFTEIGLIAQDVEKINKNFVTMAGEYKTLNQFNLLTYSLKAIQELSQENTNLKSQLKEMNERLTKLEDKINGNL